VVAGGDAVNGTELHDRSFGELLGQLSEQASALIRQEVELAKAELRQKGKRAGVGAGLIGGGGVLALGAFGAFTATLILVLATFLDAWLASLIVTVVYGAGAAALALTGKEKVQAAGSPVPEQTMQTLKEDVQWAQSQIRSDSR
jgi:1-aminocyclopropane-1-carboxylate deaminase/D-cysteine desulfhydrase-like pyridoxal-dependent ACC family enzyme